MKNIFLIFGVIFLFASCSNGSKNQTKSSESSALEDFQEQVNEIESNELASVKEVNTFVRMSGASFMPELINNPQNTHKYKATLYIAAANMGIYLSDVTYQAAYKRQEGTMLSYAAAKDLAFHIGIGAVFDEIVLKKLEEGLDKNDSVLYKLEEALEKSKTVLREKDQARLFTAITVGSYIEKLYIVNNMIFNYPEDLPDEAKLLVLRQSLMVLSIQIKQQVKLTELFKTYKPKTEKAVEVYEKMKEISDIYKPMKLEENIQSLDPKEIFENLKLLEAFDKVKEVRSMLIIE